MTRVVSEFIPNAPIREAVLRALETGEIASWHELAVRLGFVHGPDAEHNRGTGDTSRVKRMLGLLEAWGGRRPSGTVRPPRMQREISYENAVAIVRAINRDPVDFNL